MWCKTIKIKVKLYLPLIITDIDEILYCRRKNVDVQNFKKRSGSKFNLKILLKQNDRQREEPS